MRPQTRRTQFRKRTPEQHLPGHRVDIGDKNRVLRHPALVGPNRGYDWRPQEDLGHTAHQLPPTRCRFCPVRRNPGFAELPRNRRPLGTQLEVAGYESENRRSQARRGISRRAIQQQRSRGRVLVGTARARKRLRRERKQSFTSRIVRLIPNLSRPCAKRSFLRPANRFPSTGKALRLSNLQGSHPLGNCAPASGTSSFTRSGG